MTTADLIAYAAALLAAAVITWRTVRRWRDQAESARVVRRRLGLDAWSARSCKGSSAGTFCR